MLDGPFSLFALEGAGPRDYCREGPESLDVHCRPCTIDANNSGLVATPTRIKV